MKKSWLLVCLINFLIASTMGLSLRLMYVWPMPQVNYQFLLHGHSHIAMLGWVYMMLYGLIYTYFLPQKAQEKPVYKRLFWTTQVAVMGMMIYFPAQGYALFSISFSTLHILCSYYFCRLVWKDAQPKSIPQKKLLRASLLFMILSTCGVWCLGPAIGLMGKGSAFYQIAIQFFLHFQFNGWFLFAVLALFFKFLNPAIQSHKFNLFFNSLVVATFLTLALPVSWYLPHPIFQWINVAGVCLQLFAFGVFIDCIRPSLQAFWSPLHSLQKTVYCFAIFSLFLKISIQMVTIIPEMAQISHQIRNFVIGFIHLTMLGVISSFLFAFALQSPYFLSSSKKIFWGIVLFFTGFIATEFLLFMQGLYLFYGLGNMPFYYQNLCIVSLLLPVAIGILSYSVIKTN